MAGVEPVEWQTVRLSSAYGPKELPLDADHCRLIHSECQEYELIDRARGGEQEAFNELVRRHRAKALGIASSLLRDPGLSEDVVQDALIRAFLHLGTLVETAKFGPWLHRIVRNQALLRLRRGGPFAKESPFASYGGLSPMGLSEGGGKAVDWGDLDCILFRLQHISSVEKAKRNDPLECLMRQEMLQGLHALLHCLSRRERNIFEAHFFGELPPKEIANLLGTTTANIYNSLSRSRTKVRKERIRVSLLEYVKKREDLGLKKRNILAPPF